MKRNLVEVTASRTNLDLTHTQVAACKLWERLCNVATARETKARSVFLTMQFGDQILGARFMGSEWNATFGDFGHQGRSPGPGSCACPSSSSGHTHTKKKKRASTASTQRSTPSLPILLPLSLGRSRSRSEEQERNDLGSRTLRNLLYCLSSWEERQGPNCATPSGHKCQPRSALHQNLAVVKSELMIPHGGSFPTVAHI